MRLIPAKCRTYLRRFHAGRVMLEEMQSLALLGLLLCQYYLIRGCTTINESIPVAGGGIREEITRTADLLDEVAQLIADLGDAVPASPPDPGSNSPFGILLNSLLSSKQMGGNHATKSEEWEVLPNDPNPPTQ